MATESRNRPGVHLRLRITWLTSASVLPRMTSAEPDWPAPQPAGNGTAADREAEARWDRPQTQPPWPRQGSPFKEQDAPGLRFYTRLKTAAVRFA